MATKKIYKWHYSLDDGVEMVWSEVNLVWKVWSEAISSAIVSEDNLFERTLVWSEMFSNAIGSYQGPFRAPYFFHFFVFFRTERCWLCQEATIKQRSDQKLIFMKLIHYSNIKRFVQKQNFSLIRLFRAHLSLGNGLNLSLDHGLKMVWSERLRSEKSDQRPFVSGKSDQGWFPSGKSDQTKIWVWTSTWGIVTTAFMNLLQQLLRIMQQDNCLLSRILRDNSGSSTRVT